MGFAEFMMALAMFICTVSLLSMALGNEGSRRVFKTVLGVSVVALLILCVSFVIIDKMDLLRVNTP